MIEDAVVEEKDDNTKISNWSRYMIKKHYGGSQQISGK